MTLKSKEQKGQIQEILELTKQDFSDIQMVCLFLFLRFKFFVLFVFNVSFSSDIVRAALWLFIVHPNKEFSNF